MICSEFFKLLDSYETLDENQLMSLENHAAECSDCNNELKFFKSIIKTSASIPCPDPPKTLMADINRALDSEAKPVVTFTRVLENIRENVRTYATVAACFAVGIVVGLNGGYIKSRLTNNDTDGVIKETVVENKENAETVLETDDAAPQISQSPQTQKADEKPASSVKPEKPSTVKGETTQAVATNKPASETVTPQYVQGPLPIIDDKGNKKKYTIAHGNYYIPEDEVKATIAPDTDINIEGYEVAGSDVAIAYGYFDVPVEETDDSSVAFLLVNNQDMGAVVSTMSELGVNSLGGYYVTPITNFYTLMDRLDMQGIGYACDIQNNRDGEISFKLKYN